MMQRLKRIVLAAMMAVFLLEYTAQDADAFIFRMFRRRRARNYVSAPSYAFAGGPQEVAQQKANLQASRNRMFHPGGSFAGCRYEGVGSGSTPAQALSNCCYRYSKTIAGEGVAQGSNGRWYACTLYW